MLCVKKKKIVDNKKKKKKKIWDLVGILMLNSFNFAIEHGVFHRYQKHH